MADNTRPSTRRSHLHMSNKPSDILVSVIVPTYRRDAYLLLTLKSILAQTHTNLEVLIVSDGHEPATESVVADLDDPRATYYFTPHAGFPAVPRNEGLRQSKGEMLAFCDDDDLWHPTKLASQIPVLLNGNYGMCTTDYGYIDQNGDQLDRKNYYGRYHGAINWRTFFHSMGFICNAAGLFTREVYDQIGELNEQPALRAHEDFEYWMRLLFERNGFFMKEKLVDYRVHAGSIQKNSAWRVFQSRLVLHRVLKHDLPIPAADYLRKLSKLSVHFIFDRFPATKKMLGRS